MVGLPGAPHGDHGSEDFFRIEPITASHNRIGVALEGDKRGCAGRMCRREQHCCRERPVER
jgi:hypothetical protein